MSKFIKCRDPAKRGPFKSEKGVTYVEVMMGVFLLIFLIVLFIIFTDGVNMVRMSKERNQGMSVAQQKIEELQDSDFDANPGPLTVGNHGPETATRGGRNYTVSWTVGNPAFTADGTVKQIEITVEWNDGGTTRGTTLVTYRQRDM